MSDRKPYLDFKDIKARASFLDVLDRFHVQVRRLKENQYKAKCPLPSHSNEKEDGSFCVNTEKNVFCCKSESCRKAGDGASGNIIDFVRVMTGGGSTAYDAALQLSLWMAGNQKPAQANGSAGKSLAGGNEGQSHPSNSNSLPPDVNRPLAFTLKGIEHEHPLIQSRGISKETAEVFGVGFFPGKGSMAGRIVFPLMENSAIVGYAGRAVNGDEPKWKLPAGLHKSFVYGLERCDPTKPLVLGESFWLPLFLHEKGMQAASLMGCEMTAEQEAALAPFNTIVVALDNDAAGNEKSLPLVERLRKNHKVLKSASSAESVGRFWLWESSQVVI
jgi:DNA primase